MLQQYSFCCLLLQARGRDHSPRPIRALERKSRSELLHLVLSQEPSTSTYCTGSLFLSVCRQDLFLPLLNPPPFQVPACTLPPPCTMSPSLHCTRSHESPVPAVQLFIFHELLIYIFPILPGKQNSCK